MQVIFLFYYPDPAGLFEAQQATARFGGISRYLTLEEFLSLPEDHFLPDFAHRLTVLAFPIDTLKSLRIREFFSSLSFYEQVGVQLVFLSALPLRNQIPSR